MTPVDLNAAERIELRNSSTFRDLFQGKILERCAYYDGLASGDSVWANAKQWARHIEQNKSVLINDSNLTIDIEYNMLVRQFAKKDTDTAGSIPEQVIAYLNQENGVRWSYLIDDYFADHKTLLF